MFASYAGFTQSLRREKTCEGVPCILLQWSLTYASDVASSPGSPWVWLKAAEESLVSTVHACAGFSMCFFYWWRRWIYILYKST